MGSKDAAANACRRCTVIYHMTEDPARLAAYCVAAAKRFRRFNGRVGERRDSALLRTRVFSANCPGLHESSTAYDLAAANTFFEAPNKPCHVTLPTELHRHVVNAHSAIISSLLSPCSRLCLRPATVACTHCAAMAYRLSTRISAKVCRTTPSQNGTVL